MPEPSSPKPLRIAGVIALLVVVVAVFFALQREKGPPPPEPLPPLADLGSFPDWSTLEDYRGTLTREEFAEQLTGVFTIGETWRDFLTIAETSLIVKTRGGERRVPFAAAEPPRTPPRYWRPVEELPPATAELPLQDLHIALDPGHIGGDYARIEERWFQIGDAAPVMEGEMVLTVARHLAPQLEALGARVSLVRKTAAPVSTQRREDFDEFARRKLHEGTPEEIAGLSERLFYRTAEIRERARIINEELKPDLVVCLHFNAEAWGDPLNPTLTEANHFHILINGAYTPPEIAHEDERFEMLTRIFQGMHAEEAAVSEVMAGEFSRITGLPPYQYEPDSRRALNVDDNPFLWARNLLANRLYQCPVIFLEPYVMNSHEVHARIQAGDYEGTREVHGKPLPSIYREYAHAVTEGLREYYLRYRKP